MTESYRALCSDFYVNQKLSVKLDLPRGRETMLDLFERVRRSYPSMSAFRRYKDELALESPQTDLPHRWMAIRPSNIRSGVVNPGAADDAFGLHRHVLELAPFFLSISPLDVEYLEVLFGFDFAARGNQDMIVARALLSGTPLERLFDGDTLVPLEFEPVLGFVLPDDPLPGDGGDDGIGAGDLIEPEELLGDEGEGADAAGQALAGSAGGIEVHMQVKTRSGAGFDPGGAGDPISIYVTFRRYEPVNDLKDLPGALDRLAEAGQRVIDQRVIPHLVRPIREAIVSGGFE